MASFELADIGRGDMRDDIKLKIANNARAVVLSPVFVTCILFSSDGFETQPELPSILLLSLCPEQKLK